MVEVGTAINYATSGVCIVEGIKTVKIGREEKQYYQLKLFMREGAAVMVPLDNKDLISAMRPVLTNKALNAVLNGEDVCELEWIEDDGIRHKEFSGIIKYGEQKAVFALLSLLNRQKAILKEKGRHLKNSDNVLYATAEKLVLGEIGYGLNISKLEAAEVLKRFLSAALDK